MRFASRNLRSASVFGGSLSSFSPFSGGGSWDGERRWGCFSESGVGSGVGLSAGGPVERFFSRSEGLDLDFFFFFFMAAGLLETPFSLRVPGTAAR